MLRCLEEGSMSSPYPPNYIWREELVSSRWEEELGVVAVERKWKHYQDGYHGNELHVLQKLQGNKLQNVFLHFIIT